MVPILQKTIPPPQPPQGQLRVSAVEALDRKGKLFYPNPMDAPKGLGSMKDRAVVEEACYDVTYGRILADKRYKDMDTALGEYCFPLIGFDLPSHLSELAQKAARQGRKLRILDVGVGNGKQWLEFLEKYGSVVEFHAIALNDIYVEPALRGSLTLCAAAGMAHEFPEGYFDVIVSRSGRHLQGMAGLVAAERLLKAGGDMIITLHRDNMPEPGEISQFCPKLEVLCAASDAIGKKAVSYWFVKGG